MTSRILSLLSIFLVSLLLKACGGDSAASGGIEGTGSRPTYTASGPIDGFGSVIVNGVRFDTSEAIINVNENITVQDDLAIGQIVLVKGRVNEDGLTGAAQSINFIANVRGPVTQTNPLLNSLTVLGQNIILSNDTQLGDGITLNQLEDLPLNTDVEVSGLTTASGQIIATRVDIIDPPDELSLLGTITQLNIDDEHFSLNDLLVDYSQANIPNDLVLANGLNIFIKGLQQNNVFIAFSITSDDITPPAIEDITLDIEALISRFASATDFDLVGVQVTTTEATQYINGFAEDLILNASINVKGPVDANGILVAEQIEFIPINIDILVNAPVENLRASTGNSEQDTLGIIEMLGIAMGVNNTTVFADHSTMGTPFERFADIQIHNTLDARGVFDGKAVHLTQITRTDVAEYVRLRGLVSTTSGEFLIVQGVRVNIDAEATGFADVNGQVLSYGDFLNKTRGQSVFVEGTLLEEGEEESGITAHYVQLVASPNGLLLVGTAGDDQLVGTDRDDAIFGQGDDDYLIGGAGNDLLNGGEGNDALYGDAGNDQLFGAEGNDELYGREGNDIVYGGDGNDYMEGAEGNDQLFGDTDNDILIGGAGADVLDGGEGSDAVSYTSSPAGVHISLDGTAGVGGDAKGDTVLNVEGLRGSEHNDTLTGNESNNSISGEGGDDQLFGGEGNDELYGRDGHDEVHGGDGNDYMEGAEGNDQLFGDTDNDILIGGAGADVLDGGEGSDAVSYTSSPAGVHISLDGTAGVGGDAKGDTVLNVEGLRGSEHNDILTGNESNNSISGEGGDDQLFGAEGNDELYGREGNDIVHGGDGNDYMEGAEGNDQLFGDTGNDTLIGNIGHDSYEFAPDWGQDIIRNNDPDPNNHIDTIRFIGSITTADICLDRDNNHLVIEHCTSGDRIVVHNHYNDLDNEKNRIDEIVFENGTVWNQITIDNFAQN